MQVINTSGYGELTFIRTWSDGSIHIGNLAEGGFCHIGGPPISSKSELESAIPAGKHLDDALDWWENKDKVEKREDKPKIIIHPDGSYTFDDGSPIKSVADFVAYIPPGPALDAAVSWYVDSKKAETKEKESDKAATDQKTAEAKEELAKRTCVCNFRAKRVVNKDGSLNLTGLMAHQRTCKAHQAELQKAA